MNNIVLSLYIIFGIIIIAGYIYNTISSGKDLWNNVKNKHLKNVYKIMIFLSFIFGVYLLYFFTFVKNENKELLYSGLILLLVFSSIWAWAPYYHNKIVLLLVSIGALLLLVNTSMQVSHSQNIKNAVALFACILLFIQTFVFDFIIWNGIGK